MPSRRRRRSKSSLRTYLLITLACGAAALLAHFLFEAPDQMRRLAEDQVEEAMRKAVRQEVKRAADRTPR